MKAAAVALTALLGACTPAPDPIAVQAAPYIEFMTHSLLQPSGQGNTQALAETAAELGEARWFWTDDNAKALELFAVPALYNAHPQTAAQLLDFVQKMSEGDMLFRRAGLPQLMIESADPTKLKVSAGFLNIQGNLRDDLLTLSMRYHDGRTQAAMHLGDHQVRFRSGTASFNLNAREQLETTQVIVRADSLRLVLRSSIMNSATPPTRIARLWVRYDFPLGAPWFTRSVDFKVLDARGAQNVELDLSLPRLRELAPIYAQLCVIDLSLAAHCKAADRDHLELTPAALYSVANQQSMSFAYALNVRPEQPPARLQTRTTEQALSSLTATYALGEMRQGEKKSVRETMVLSNGQLSEQSASFLALLKDPKLLNGMDLSLSYDYGAELNAVACLNWRLGDRFKNKQLRPWFDRHFAKFQTASRRPPSAGLNASVMTRGLSFTLLALDCMARAIPDADYQSKLSELQNKLIGLQITQADDPRRGAFEGGAVAGVYLDVQASALLALARIALRGNLEPAAFSALREGLRALKIEQGRVYLHNDSLNPNARTQDEWSYSQGLLARAMATIELAQARGELGLDALELAHVAEIKKLNRALIVSAFKPTPHGVEILTQRFASEGNSETQSWALLGLLEFDEQLISGPAR